MVDFRKWFSVLVVVALMLSFGITASAQTYTCNASAGSPPSLRQEGYTELAGDILLTCTWSLPTIPTSAISLNIQLFATTNITSRLLTSGTAGLNGGANYTEALLLINDPIPANVNPADYSKTPVALPTAGTGSTQPGVSATVNGGIANAFRAVKASDSSIVWAGMNFLPPGTTFTLRMTNVRVNATTVTAGLNLPGQVNAFLAISGNTAVSVNNPNQIIGIVQSGLTFAVRNCGNTSDTAVGINQCNAVLSNLLDTTALTNSAQMTLKYTEGFAYAFKTGLTATQDPSSSGTNYLSESGYVNSTALGNETGFASQGFLSSTSGAPAKMGTRLKATFSSVPAGVDLYVATQPCTGTGGLAIPGTGLTTATISGVAGSGAAGTSPYWCGSATVYAQLLQGTDSNGFGGTAASAVGTSTINCTAGATIAGIANMKVAKVAIDPLSGSGFAVWEVINADPNLPETIYAPVAIKSSPALNATPVTPGIGTGSVTGSFAPAYATGLGADKASASLPIPRFLEKPTNSSLFTVNVCRTNLLFTFVSTVPGWDTGIAIANTSMDPFSSSNLQAGVCNLRFYQAGAVLPTITTPSVAAGSVLAFTMFNGVPVSDGTTKSIQNFNGYMIAQCEFLYGHGFAFLSDLGATKLAQGYLALVMGTSSSRGSNVAANETLGN